MSDPVALAYDEYGSGPPLLILHGLLGQSRNWASQAKRFSQDYRTLAVDLRNHGRSPWADGMTYEQMAEDIALLAETIGPPVHVIGHSMGGKVGDDHGPEVSGPGRKDRGRGHLRRPP